LTSELRRLLYEWNLSAQSVDPFLDAIRVSFNNPSSHPDCTVIFHTNTFSMTKFETTKFVYVHRIILQARCPVLAQNIVETTTESCSSKYHAVIHTNSSSELVLDEQSHPYIVMMLLLEYLYTGILSNIRSIDIAILLRDLSSLYKLDIVCKQLDESIKKYHVKYGTVGPTTNVFGISNNVEMAINSRPGNSKSSNREIANASNHESSRDENTTMDLRENTVNTFPLTRANGEMDNRNDGNGNNHFDRGEDNEENSNRIHIVNDENDSDNIIININNNNDDSPRDDCISI
jgi:BTB/POZ domain